MSSPTNTPFLALISNLKPAGQTEQTQSAELSAPILSPVLICGHCLSDAAAALENKGFCLSSIKRLTTAETIEHFRRGTKFSHELTTQ